MKRSAKACLLLMAALSAPSCGASKDDARPQAFASQEECVAAGNEDAQCRQWQEAALKEQPKFASKEECERKFGAEACKQDGGQAGALNQGHSGGFWMPAMLGFMAGHALSGGSGLFGNPARPDAAKTAAGAPASGRINAGAARSGRLGGGANLGSQGGGRILRGGFSGGGRSSAAS